MKALEDLNADVFEAHLDGRFGIAGHAVTLKSVDVKPSGHTMFREKVCLLFEAENDLGFMVDTVQLAHPEIGRHQLLVNRVQNPEDQQDGPPLYEIVLA